MKLAIFGATGRTGLQLVAQALAAGHEVTVLARRPEKLAVGDGQKLAVGDGQKLAVGDGQLTIVQGDVTDAGRVAEAVAGAEAVLSVLGPTSNKPEYLVSQGMGHIIAAMKAHGVRRLVVSAGAGVADPGDDPQLFHKVVGLLVRTLSRHVYEDMVRTVATVRSSELDWTIVRVPMLTDDPPTGKWKVGYVGRGPGARLSRADLAAFMLAQATDDRYLGQAPVVSN
jgi:putative NADH-flavin reductase